MASFNPDDLENAINSVKTSEKKVLLEESNGKMSAEEEIGFHKGALNTLMAERNELVKMAGTVEAIMQAHIRRLEELGVKLQ